MGYPPRRTALFESNVIHPRTVSGTQYFGRNLRSESLDSIFYWIERVYWKTFGDDGNEVCDCKVCVDF